MYAIILNYGSGNVISPFNQYCIVEATSLVAPTMANVLHYPYTHAFMCTVVSALIAPRPFAMNSVEFNYV